MDSIIKYIYNVYTDDNQHDFVKTLMETYDPSQVFEIICITQNLINIDMQMIYIFQDYGIDLNYQYKLITKIMRNKFEEEINNVLMYLLNNFDYDINEIYAILLSKPPTLQILSYLLDHEFVNESLLYCLSTIKRNNFFKMQDIIEKIIVLAKNKNLITNRLIYSIIIYRSTDIYICYEADKMKIMENFSKEDFIYPFIYMIVDERDDIDIQLISEVMLFYVSRSDCLLVSIKIFKDVLKLTNSQTTDLCKIVTKQLLSIDKKNPLITMRSIGISIDDLIRGIVDDVDKLQPFLVKNIFSNLYIYMHYLEVSLDEIIDEIIDDFIDKQ